MFPTTAQMSPIFLVAANLLPLVGVLLWDWDVGAILLFYWAENLIIGVFNVVKLLSLGIGSIFFALFFAVHYGGFCAGHGFFLASMFELAPLEALGNLGTSGGFETIGRFSALVPNFWLWGLAALVVSHGLSVLVNWFGRNERAQTTSSQLMTAPYQRIVILHVVIIFGGIAVEFLGSPIALLLVLVIVKIVIDLRAHLKEHGLSWRSLLGAGEPVTSGGVTNQQNRG